MDITGVFMTELTFYLRPTSVVYMSLIKMAHVFNYCTVTARLFTYLILNCMNKASRIELLCPAVVYLQLKYLLRKTQTHRWTEQSRIK